MQVARLIFVVLFTLANKSYAGTISTPNPDIEEKCAAYVSMLKELIEKDQSTLVVAIRSLKHGSETEAFFLSEIQRLNSRIAELQDRLLAHKAALGPSLPCSQ